LRFRAATVFEYYHFVFGLDAANFDGIFRLISIMKTCIQIANSLAL